MKRRRFFQQIFGDGVTFIEELSGRPQLRLKDLWHCSDEQLQRIRPTFVTGVTVFAVGDRMLGRRGPADPVDLYGLDEPGTFVLSRFDGRSPLAEIVVELASVRGWEAARATAYAKEVFLRLVALGLCAPTNPLTDDMAPAPCQAGSHDGGMHE